MTILKRLKTLFFLSLVLVVVDLYADSVETKSILFVNAGWRGLPHEDLLEAKYVADLKLRDFAVDVANLADVDRARLSRYNVAVLLWLPPEPHGDLVDIYRRALPALRDFVESGGGLFFNYTEAGTSVIYERTYHRLANELFAPWGLTAIPEVVRDPTNSFRHDRGMQENFVRTKNLVRHPIGEGIDEIYFPSYWWDQNSFTIDRRWTAIARAERSAYTTADVDAPTDGPHARGSIPSEPPIFAVREVGKGRVVFDTISPVYTFSAGYHMSNDGVVLEDGNVFCLHVQAYQWLAAPSLAAGKPGGFEGPSYTPATAKKVEFTDVRVVSPELKGPAFARNLPTFFGLYGAHSNLTDGKASVAEFCERARELGYSWLVFTDPLELMSEEKYAQLVDLCAAASRNDFLALPGMEYESDRLWAPRIELPSSEFGPSLPGRGHGRPRFVITYIKQWVGAKLGAKPPGKDPILSNYPLSPDGSYVVDNGIIYVSNGQPRQCLIAPKGAGVGPWHTVLYNGFATHSYDGRSLVDDSLDWFFDRIGNDYRITPMTYHRILRPQDIPRIGETFVSAARAEKLSKLTPQGAGLVYPWRNHNYVTSGPKIDLYGVAVPDRPRDYLVLREAEWKCGFEVSSDVGLAEVILMDGTRVFRRYALHAAKRYADVIVGHFDKQHYFTLRVRDVHGKEAVSGAQVVHGWRHWYGMSGADLIQCNDSTFQVDSRGKLDFAWGTGGVLAGGAEIGPRLNVPHTETTPIARDAHSPRMGGRTGVMIDTDKGSEWSLNRLDMHFASEECTVLDQVHENHPEPGLAPVRNTIARGHVRWYSFTPRLYDWNFLLVETNVELLRDVELKKPHEWAGPPLCTLSYSPSEINSMDRFVHRAPEGTVSREVWGPLAGRPKNSPFQHRALDVGGYVGLYPGKTASLVVYSLDGNAQLPVGSAPNVQDKHVVRAQVSLVDSNLRFGFGRGGEKLLKGQRFSFHYLVGLKYLMSDPEDFEKIRRLYGLDNEAPCYSVDLDVGEVVSTQYALRLRANRYAVRGRITSCPELPSDLPLMLEGMNDRWNVSLYDYDRGTIKRVGSSAGVAYSAVDINIGPRNLFFGHPFVCDDQRIVLNLHRVEGEEPGQPKVAVVGLHNPTHEDLDVSLRSPLFGVRNRVRIAAGSSQMVRLPLADWTVKRITVHTNELTAQIPRRGR